MFRFIDNKYINPKLTQKQIANEPVCSDFTLRRYKTDKNLNSLHSVSQRQTTKKPQKTETSVASNPIGL